MRRLSDRLRCLVPPRLARHLPDRRRCKHIRARISQRRWQALAPLVGQRDPFECGTLWLAVEQILDSGDMDALVQLRPMAARASAFEQAVFAALCKLPGDAEAAIAALSDIGEGSDFGPFERMGARAWSLYLSLPRQALDRPASKQPRVVQFWDRPEPPPEVAAQMARWSALCGPGYRRFDDDSAAALLRSAFGPEAETRFRAAPHPAIRSDYFRLGYLAAEGGVYIDADSAPCDGAEATLAALGGGTTLVFEPWRGGKQVLNGVIAAKAGHPLLLECFHEAGRRLDQDGRPVQALAGGHMMTDTVLWMAREGKLGPVQVLSSAITGQRLLRSIQAGYKSGTQNWRLWDAERQAGQTP